MSRRRLAIIFVITAGAIGIIGTWSWHRRPLLSRFQQKVTGPPDKRVSTSDNPPSSASTETESEIKRQERVRSLRVAIERANVPIAFFGKVTDQDDNALPDVSVIYNYSVEEGNSVGVPWSNTKVVKGQAMSDSSGAFAIAGIKGSALHIESLQKSGFRHHVRGAMVFNYFGRTASDKFIANPDKPVVFVMVNQSIDQPLVSSGGTFGKTLRLPGDGTPIRWNLWKGQVDPNGELRITFKRDPVVLALVGQSATWSARVGIVAGGIIEAPPDEPFYRAPLDGYVAELEYPTREQKPGMSARAFYVKTAGGKYARLQMELYPDDEGSTVRCLLKIAINPSGSRNLEGE